MNVYLDNAATTSLDTSVLEAMLPYMTEIYGNPSSVHAYGRKARAGIDRARDITAAALNALSSEIIFTGGGTESDNMAILGAVRGMRSSGNHIITTAVEHHAVLHVCERLEKEGYKVTYLPVDEHGMISVEQVDNAITDDTILVTVMFANNETGTIMPIAEIGAICRKHGILFHTDAVQAVGHIPIDVQAMNIDMLSLSAHKFHGPKGVGALYVRKGVRIYPFIVGGAQENNKRAGTENVAGIVGLGAALNLALSELEERSSQILVLRDRLISGILSNISEVKLNGHPTNRLPNNVNVSIRYIEGESILLMLDMSGIAASSGSACTSGSLDPSHVLLAMGLTHEVAHGSVRLTLSKYTTQEEIDYTIEQLVRTTQRLRAMSPLYTPSSSSVPISESCHRCCNSCSKNNI